jgi:lipopolysaccharide biosynthesis glycosyltransferase
MKILAYYTHGFSNEFLPILKLSIRSLRKYNKIDTLVLCDEQFEKDCKAMGGIETLSLKNSKKPEDASMHKLSVFSFEEIKNYDKVIFIDSDIIIDVKLNKIIEKCLDEQKLYACSESNDISLHRNLYWSLENYTEKEMEFFKKNKIYVFNAGCFIFTPNKEFKTHFQEIKNIIKEHKGSYFYEQSFMNFYFNKKNLVDYSVLNEKNYILHANGDKKYRNSIVHFCGNPGVAAKKLERMKKYLNENKNNKFLC